MDWRLSMEALLKHFFNLQGEITKDKVFLAFHRTARLSTPYFLMSGPNPET